MAVLDNSDYRAYLRALFQDAAARVALRSANPSKADLKAAFQGLENWWTAEEVNAKAAMEAASGLTIPAGFARKLAKVWMLRKIGVL